MHTWDAIVVGGGPAGSATAARLAAGGCRVLLLDRERFPRRKPCGECVNPAAVAALRQLGAWPAVEELPHAPLLGWTIAAPGGDRFTGRFPSEVRGIAVARTVFDHALLRFAEDRGAEVRTGVRVTELERQGSRVAGVRTAAGEVLRARVVIGADGLRSAVARRLGLPRRAPRLLKIALTAHLEDVAVPAGCGELRASANGCLGVAAVGEGLANVTVVVAGAGRRDVAGEAERYFDEAVARYGLAGRRVDEVLATGPFDCPMRDVVADGALLVGDAAGYYDPFTGQGIYRALRGAELAAGALLPALAAGEVSAAALRGYARAEHREFAPGERLQHLVEAFVSRPRWLGWAARRLTRRPALGDSLIRATGDLVHPRTLLRPSLLAQLAF